MPAGRRRRRRCLPGASSTCRESRRAPIRPSPRRSATAARWRGARAPMSLGACQGLYRMTATYTFDVFSSLDGYGAASANWTGYWGKQGPELLDHRLALYDAEQRMVFGE